jgi:5'-3' exonuclease
MGIRGLERIIKNNNTKLKNKSIISSNLKYFKNKYVGIDTSEFIVKSLIKDKNYHVSGILNLLEKCLKYNIIPCFVFDGKPPKEKKNKLDERFKRKIDAQEKLKLLIKEGDNITEINNLLEKLNILNNNLKINNNSEYTNNNLKINNYLDTNNNLLNEIEKKKIKNEIISRLSSLNNLIDLENNDTPFLTYNNIFDNTFKEDIQQKLLIISEEKKKVKKKCHNYGNNHIKDIQELFDLLQIPYINSTCEADIICASLCKLGIVDAVISNDMDFIILGTPIVIRNLNFKNDNIQLYIYDNILKNLNFTHEKIIELSLLLGCDYCHRLINIKNKYVFDIFKHFKNLDDLIYNLKNIKSYFNNLDNVNNTILEYINEETFILDETIDIKKIKNLFILDINHDIVNDMITNLDIKNINNIFINCKNHINNISNNSNLFNKVIKYCINKCSLLNYNLINNKCKTICGINKSYLNKHNNKLYYNNKNNYNLLTKII